jgi:phosphatidylglycerophosphate synthase
VAQPPTERESGRGADGGAPARSVGGRVLLKEFWNVPNLLTFGRILIIPLFIELAYQASPWPRSSRARCSRWRRSPTWWTDGWPGGWGW